MRASYRTDIPTHQIKSNLYVEEVKNINREEGEIRYFKHFNNYPETRLEWNPKRDLLSSVEQYE